MSSCLIIGAGDGVSASVAQRFGADGFAVGLIARDEARLSRVAATVAGSVAFAPADASDPRELATAIVKLESTLGACEVLVYNAATPTSVAASDLSADTLTASLAVDVVGAVAAVQAVLDGMLERETGTMLFTGGGLALYPAAGAAGLSVGKAAIRAFALALHADLQPRGLHAATVTIAGAVARDGTGIDPDRIAAEFLELHHQDPDAWDSERVVR